jgi:hypothetical protein
MIADVTSPARSIRPAYSNWPAYNGAVRDSVAGLSDDQLALRARPDSWPMWAIVGHLTCQRVFWLCDFAGVERRPDTPYPNAIWDCPGDDDLEHVLGSEQLVSAIDATFRIVEDCLDTWTLDQLGDELGHPEWPGGPWAHRRGSVIQRVFVHDVWHIEEASNILADAGLPRIDLWI